MQTEFFVCLCTIAQNGGVYWGQASIEKCSRFAVTIGRHAYELRVTLVKDARGVQYQVGVHERKGETGGMIKSV